MGLKPGVVVGGFSDEGFLLEYGQDSRDPGPRPPRRNQPARRRAWVRSEGTVGIKMQTRFLELAEREKLMLDAALRRSGNP